MIEVREIPVKNIVGNKGQIKGLPKNPRLIKDEKYRKLVRSIEEDPEMMELRELIVIPHDDYYIAICGNMRLQALNELGIEIAPCKVLPEETPLQKLKAYTIKDNVGFGEHDWELLANEWDSVELEEWGLDVPTFTDIDSDEFEEESEPKQKPCVCPNCGHDCK